MVEPLSSGYYMESFSVAVHQQSSNPAFLNEQRQAQLNEEVYLDDTEDTTDTVAVVADDNPLVMKLGTQHLLVYPHEEVPDGVLAVPPRASDTIDSSTGDQPVLIAKKDRAEQLARLLGGVPE